MEKKKEDLTEEELKEIEGHLGEIFEQVFLRPIFNGRRDKLIIERLRKFNKRLEEIGIV